MVMTDFRSMQADYDLGYVEGKGYPSFRARVIDRQGHRWWIGGSLGDIELTAIHQGVRVLRVEPDWSPVRSSPPLAGRPVVLIAIGSDSYGGESTTFAGHGDPYVADIDFSRYDKYNRNEGDNPYDDYAESLNDLAKINHEAHAMLKSWIDDIGTSLGITGPTTGPTTNDN
jgi:hypothetical protein